MDNPIPFHLLVHKFWEVHPILMSCAKFIFCYTKWPFHSENSTIFKRYTSPVNLCGQDMRWSCCRMPELEEGGCTELCDLCGKVWRQFVCLFVLFVYFVFELEEEGCTEHFNLCGKVGLDAYICLFVCYLWSFWKGLLSLFRPDHTHDHDIFMIQHSER